MIEIPGGKTLLKRCREGEETAFRELYYRYNKAMYNVCMRMLNNSAEAEDVLQESFVDAFRKIGALKEEKAFGSWLRRIVLNRCIDRVRTRKSWEALEDAHAAVEDEGDEEPATVDPRIVHTALSMLPEGYRVIVTLFLFEELSHRAIADKLGITEGTSKSQYARGRRKLAALIMKLSNER